ncbi:unnamed protein product [Arctia plantaginis]|uniref:Nuclease HARBI1 n=1 Tax=Arctia plantaginis TaxID=874455 RepID=A0A8S1AXG6_ARCPL|nr:unnamed protein product [Arctia plantaginis]
MMTNKLTLFEFLECDNDISSRKKCRRDLREDTDPFIAFEDEEFIKRYRLSKQLVLDLCEELGPMFRKPVRSTYLSVEIKILTALSFYGTGSYRRPIGDISAHSMAQQTVSSVMAEVTACIDSPNMRRKYIHFPQTPEERNKTRARFYQKFNIPGVLGCIDCTQVAIMRPIDHEERYYYRKHYHSLNVQLLLVHRRAIKPIFIYKLESQLKGPSGFSKAVFVAFSCTEFYTTDWRLLHLLLILVLFYITFVIEHVAAVDPDAVHTDNEALHQGVSTRSSLIRRLWSSVLS